MLRKPWIKRPVVLLGLAFNAAYLAYYFFGGAFAGRPAVRQRKAPDAAAPAVVSFRGGFDNQTNVYPTEDLMLVKESGRRLQFAPISTASGAAEAPSVVHLRFYSFAREPQYQSERQLRMSVDGREVWKSTDVVYSLTGGDAEVVESLGGRIGFAEFERAVNGRVVTLTVGREEIELSPGQVLALRRMVWCALGDPCG